MTRIVSILVAAALALGMATSSDAQSAKPTQEEVKALTLDAATLLAAEGLEKARAIFHQDGKFKYGEVYVNVIDLNGVWLVYPPRPAGEGQSVINVKDADGKMIVQEILKTAKESGEGWVDYRWLNPASNRIEPKISYVKQVPGKEWVTYVGVYK